MSIVGIGTDLVQRQRIAEALERYGEAFARRILTPQEWPSYLQSSAPAAMLAKRFAVKEALAKALGTGIGADFSFQDVSLGHDERGRPALCFSATAEARLEARGITQHHVSVSDEGDYALAFVVLSQE